MLNLALETQVALEVGRGGTLSEVLARLLSFDTDVSNDPPAPTPLPPPPVVLPAPQTHNPLEDLLSQGGFSLESLPNPHHPLRTRCKLFVEREVTGVYHRRDVVVKKIADQIKTIDAFSSNFDGLDDEGILALMTWARDKPGLFGGTQLLESVFGPLEFIREGKVREKSERLARLPQDSDESRAAFSAPKPAPVPKESKTQRSSRLAKERKGLEGTAPRLI